MTEQQLQEIEKHTPHTFCDDCAGTGRRDGETCTGCAGSELLIGVAYVESLIAEVRRLQQEPRGDRRILTRYPSCGGQTLFLSPSGHLTCSLIGCEQPVLARWCEAVVGQRDAAVATALAERDAEAENCRLLQDRLQRFIDAAKAPKE